MQLAVADPSAHLCSYDGAIYGDRQAKKMAKGVGMEYLRSGGPGQPRYVKSPMEPFGEEEFAEVEKALERGLVPSALMFKRKLGGYRAAFTVETNRAVAEQLRRDDPALYQQILALADGEAARAASRDPDAYVALVLAEAGKQGLTARDLVADPDQSDADALTEAIRAQLLTLPGGLPVEIDLALDINLVGEETPGALSTAHARSRRDRDARRRG